MGKLSVTAKNHRIAQNRHFSKWLDAVPPKHTALYPLHTAATKQHAAAKKTVTTALPGLAVDSFVTTCPQDITQPEIQGNLSPLTSRPLSMSELLNIQKKTLKCVGLVATNGLRLSVAIGSFVALGASLIITVAGPWIHVFGLGAAVFGGILLLSVLVGFVAQHIARRRNLSKMVESSEYVRDRARVQATYDWLKNQNRETLSGDGAVRLYIANRMLNDLEWGAKEKVRQVVRGYFGEGELLVGFTKAMA